MLGEELGKIHTVVFWVLPEFFPVLFCGIRCDWWEHSAPTAAKKIKVHWSISNSPHSLTRNRTSHSMMKNLASHSLLRWQLIILPILTTSLRHFSLKAWENVLFEKLPGVRQHLFHCLPPTHPANRKNVRFLQVFTNTEIVPLVQDVDG